MVSLSGRPLGHVDSPVLGRKCRWTPPERNRRCRLPGARGKDAGNGASQLIRRPNLLSDDRESAWTFADLVRIRDAVSGWIDLRHSPVAAVRHPDRAEPEPDTGGAPADRNRVQPLSVTRTQLGHGVARLARDPDCAVAYGDRDGIRTSGVRLEQLPGVSADLGDGVVACVRDPHIAVLDREAGGAVPNFDVL